MRTTAGISSNESWARGAIADAPALLDVGVTPAHLANPVSTESNVCMAVDKVLP
jgi:hypothetical protein